MSPVEKAYHVVVKGIENAYNTVGEFLDNNPVLYKIVQVANHFFRSLAMFGLMVWLPIPMPVTACLMVGGTLLYKAAVERFCSFRFAIPSLVGAGALWLARLAVINFISGTALSSVGMTIACALAFIPLAAYTAWVVYIAHTDIERRKFQLKELDKCVDQATVCSGCS